MLETSKPTAPQGPWFGDVRRSDQLYVVCLLIIALSAVNIAWNTKTSAIRNTNVGSRFATVQALVDHGTYAIDKTQYKHTIDKVKIDGKLYSSKPPMLPTLGAGVYYIQKKLTGVEITKKERNVVLTVNLALAMTPHILLMLMFFQLMRVSVRDETVIIVSTFIVAFGFLAAGYATELNNHSVAAMLMTVVLYQAFRCRHDPQKTRWRFAVAGVAAGLLPTIDMPSLAFTVAAMGYLILVDWKKTLAIYLPLVLLLIGASEAMLYIATESFLPVTFKAAAYKAAGGYWKNPRGMDALREPKLVYMFHTLVGHHGWFSMTPPVLLGFVGLFASLKRGRPLLLEAGYTGSTLLVLTTFYIVRTHNYGGSCMGFRWLIPLTPLTFFWFARFVDDELDRNRSAFHRRMLWLLIFVAVTIAGYHTAECMDRAWLTSGWHKLFR